MDARGIQSKANPGPSRPRDLRGHLPEVRISGTAAGLHLRARLPDGADEHATAMRASAPASACMSCTATAQPMRHLLRRSSSVSRFRVSPS
jgi:hypothetical protein